MNVHVQEVSMVDGLGREVELVCHDEISGNANLEAGCWWCIDREVYAVSWNQDILLRLIQQELEGGGKTEAANAPTSHYLAKPVRKIFRRGGVQYYDGWWQKCCYQNDDEEDEDDDDDEDDGDDDDDEHDDDQNDDA